MKTLFAVAASLFISTAAFASPVPAAPKAKSSTRTLVRNIKADAIEHGDKGPLKVSLEPNHDFTVLEKFQTSPKAVAAWDDVAQGSYKGNKPTSFDQF